MLHRTQELPPMRGVRLHDEGVPSNVVASCGSGTHLFAHKADIGQVALAHKRMTCRLDGQECQKVMEGTKLAVARM